MVERWVSIPTWVFTSLWKASRRLEFIAILTTINIVIWNLVWVIIWIIIWVLVWLSCCNRVGRIGNWFRISLEAMNNRSFEEMTKAFLYSINAFIFNGWLELIWYLLIYLLITVDLTWSKSKVNFFSMSWRALVREMMSNGVKSDF